jgi:glyoxylase-like metal-dependent hydrolase (beta-lactamase superfamily II)
MMTFDPRISPLSDQLNSKNTMKIKPSLVRVAVSTLLVAVTAWAPAFAAAPMVKTSGPGYFRMMLGDFEITALSDGTVDLPVDKLLTNTTPAKVNKALAKSFLKAPVEASVNAYLVNTGSKLILIDTGAAKLFGPTLGNLTANLKAAGYQPEQVDEVYITHMHPDHVGGLMDGDKMTFPNATVRADKRDADFWLSQANLDKAPADSKGFFQGAMASLNPYVKASKFLAFDGNTDLFPGVKAVATRGHTPGHSNYVVESKGQKLVLWGDLIHVAAVQFDEPAVTIAFDSDSKAAAAQRKRAYAEAVKGGYLVGAAHIAFPGIGHVRANGKAYAWVPVNYTVNR